MTTVRKGKNWITKERITAIVEKYIEEHRSDYELVKQGIAMTRQMTRDEYASLEGSSASRALYEIPEDLNNMFILNLSEEEMVWFKTKEGAHWFTRTFKAFALPQWI